MKFFVIVLIFIIEFKTEKIRIDIDDMTDIYVGNVPDSQKCQLWNELKLQYHEEFVLVNYQIYSLDKNSDGFNNLFKEFDAKEVNFKQQIHWEKMELNVKTKYRIQLNFELDLPFDFQPELNYVCNTKYTKIYDENNNIKEILVLSITGYDSIFDISLIEYRDVGDQYKVYIHKSILNHTQYYDDIKVIKTMDIPKYENQSEIKGINFTIGRKQLKTAKEFVLNNNIQFTPYKFVNPFDQLNSFFILGGNDSNQIQIQTEIKEIDGQNYLRLHFRTLSAYFEYTVERDEFQENLNTSNDKCYNIVINYIHQEIINKAILGQFQLGCFNKDVKYSLQKFFLFDVGEIYMQWGFLGVDRDQSNIIEFIIRTDMDRLSIKKQYIYTPFFRNTGYIYPRVHIKNNKIYAILLYNDRNLIGINFSYDTPRMEQYRQLNQLSGRLSGIDEKASQDCLIDNRTFKNQNLQENSKIKNYNNIFVQVIDKFVETNNHSKQQMQTYFTNTISEVIDKKKLIGPFFMNDGAQPSCWIQQDHKRLNLFLLSTSLGSPFTDSLIVLKKINQMLTLQIYKDRSTLLCAANAKQVDDIDIFSTEVDINYIRTIDGKESVITTHFIQNEEYPTYHNQNNLVIVDKYDVLKINDFLSCNIQFKNGKLIIDAHILDERQRNIFLYVQEKFKKKLLQKMIELRRKRLQKLKEAQENENKKLI